MPRLTILSVRLALVQLLLGFGIGALLLISKATGAVAGIWTYLPLHIDLLLIGWMAQLAIGVAFWILPRFAGGQRPHAWLAWLAVAAVNIGILIVGADAVHPETGSFQLLGKSLQAGGLIAFIAHAWPRVKAPGAG